MRRGQSTVELALLIPVIALLIAATLEGGVLISDQINLNAAAYEGGLWAVSNPSSATVDAASSGTIAQHVYAQLCGGNTSSPSTSGTRFCKHVNGVTDLSVQVTSRPTNMAYRRPWTPVTEAFADSCNRWRLALSPLSASVAPGATQVFTATLSPTTNSDNDPVVSLTGSGYPPNLAAGNPLFNPPSVTVAPGNVSRLTINTRVDTPPGTYTITIAGQDQCGVGPDGGDSTVSLVVQGPTPSPSPTAAAGASAVISSVNPASICSGTISTITISGANLPSGALVTVGTTGATSVSLVSSSQLTAVLPVFPVGTYNVTVTSPGGASTTLQNALAVVLGCSAPTPPPVGLPCAGGPGRYQTVITITWKEPLVVGLLAGPGLPAVTLTAGQVVNCQ